MTDVYYHNILNMMGNIPKPIAFEWDTGNSDKNRLKHKVDAKEAEEVFFNKPFLTVPDQKHSVTEMRFQALGKTNSNRKLFVSYTIRNNKIRVISIRDMNKKEQSIYEKA